MYSVLSSILCTCSVKCLDFQCYVKCIEYSVLSNIFITVYSVQPHPQYSILLALKIFGEEQALLNLFGKTDVLHQQSTTTPSILNTASSDHLEEGLY